MNPQNKDPQATNKKIAERLEYFNKLTDKEHAKQRQKRQAHDDGGFNDDDDDISTGNIMDNPT